MISSAVRPDCLDAHDKMPHKSLHLIQVLSIPRPTQTSNLLNPTFAADRRSFPVLMSHHWHSTLSFLLIVLLADFAMATVQWDNMRVMHTWDSVPENWESLGNTTDGARINLHIVLQPERESAMIDTLLEVSDPSHPRHVLATPPVAPLFTCAALFQIWSISF